MNLQRHLSKCGCHAPRRAWYWLCPVSHRAPPSLSRRGGAHYYGRRFHGPGNGDINPMAFSPFRARWEAW